MRVRVHVYVCICMHEVVRPCVCVCMLNYTRNPPPSLTYTRQTEAREADHFDGCDAGFAGGVFVCACVCACVCVV
jgi:hypothetical protein